MTTSPNTGVQHIEPNQNQKEVTANAGFDRLSRFYTEEQSYAVTGSFTVTATEYQEAFKFTLTGTPGGAFTVTLPAGLKKMLLVDNQTGQTATVQVDDGGGGAAGTTVAVEASRTRWLYVDGTDVESLTFLNPTLDSLSNLGTAADKMAYTTAVNTWAETPLTAAGRALLDDADATEQRGTLGAAGTGVANTFGQPQRFNGNIGLGAAAAGGSVRIFTEVNENNAGGVSNYFRLHNINAVNNNRALWQASAAWGDGSLATAMFGTESIGSDKAAFVLIVEGGSPGDWQEALRASVDGFKPGYVVDLTAIAASAPILKANATTGTPASSPEADPEAGWLEIEVGGATRYIPFYT